MSEFRVTRGGDYNASDYIVSMYTGDFGGAFDVQVLWSPANDTWLAVRRTSSESRTSTLTGFVDGDYYGFRPSADGLYADLRDNTLKVQVTGGKAGDYLMAGSGDDVLNGDDGNDTLFGYDGKDTLSGGSGNDTLDGGAGDDVLDGGAGNDSFIGGDGIDTVSYATATGAVTLRPYTIVHSQDDIQYGVNTGGLSAGDTFSSIENFTGSAFNDVLSGHEDSTANVLSGLGGDDTITVGSGDTGYGGDGDDRFSAGFNAAGFTIDGGANTGGGDSLSMTLFGEEEFVLSATGLTRGGSPFAAITGIENYSFSSFATTNKISIGAVTGNVNLNFVSPNLVSVVDASGTIAGTTVRFSGATGADTYIGGAGQDEITFSTNGLTVVNLTGSTKTVNGVDYLAGTALDGTGSTDSITGSIERLSVGSSAGNAVFLGDNGARVDAGSGNDLLVGGAGRDYLYGEGGDDRLIGGTGYDWFEGGNGIDTVSYNDSATFVRVDLGNTINNDGEATYDRFFDIENVVGTDLNDTLVGNGLANVLRGGAGADLLSGGGGDDRLEGDDGDDTLNGGDGADVLRGGAGADSLDGGAGDDRIVITASPTLVDGGSGTADQLLIDGNVTIGAGNGRGIETVIVMSGSADFTGNTMEQLNFRSRSAAGGSITITGSEGADTIIGGAGGDVLSGGGGNDRIQIYNGGSANGGAGDDMITLRAVGSLVHGGSGTGDLLSISGDLGLLSFDDTSFSGFERIQVGSGSSIDVSGVSPAATQIRLLSLAGTTSSATGGAGVEKVTGGAGDDVLVGNDGNDVLNGGAGSDTLTGGAGADTMTGGAGADVFRWDALADMGAGTARDRIFDFAHGVDKIDLGAIDTEGSGFSFIGTGAFSGDADAFEVRLAMTKTPGLYQVQIDVTHDGKADYSFNVISDAPLTVDDFSFAV